jgi:hypothetical protein
MLFHGPRLVGAPHIVQRWRWFWLALNIGLAMLRNTHATEFLEVAMHQYTFLEHPLHRRMKARQQRRVFPSLWRDLRRDVGTGKASWEHPVEELVQLLVRQPRCFVIAHVRESHRHSREINGSGNGHDRRLPPGICGDNDHSVAAQAGRLLRDMYAIVYTYMRVITAGVLYGQNAYVRA